MPPPLQTKTALITGATTGIGYFTALELARKGANLILLGRNRASCETTAATIRRETATNSIEIVCADLSSLQSVRDAAHSLRDHPRIDILINNAGAIHALRRESVDGNELTLATNHLGPFLLTRLLLPKLIAAAPGRIVNVSSSAHKDVRAFDFDDPQALHRAYPRTELSSLFYTLVMPWAHPGFHQYAMTKLANILFTTELARRLTGKGVTANALHPGLVNTPFTRGNGSLGWFMRRYMSIRGITPKDGARTSIYCAAGPELELVTGKYFDNEKEATPSPAAQNQDAAQRLWKLTEQLTGLAPT